MAEEFFTWLQREKRLELSAQQRQAVETTEGAVLLTATPGSGKTTVIVCRTAYLLREKKIPAGQILTLTFGKQSQLDMDRRFAALFPEMEKPRFSTLHALSLSILRRYCEITGGAMFSLLPDSAPVVRELLRKQINGFISEELLRNALSALECEAVQTGKHTAQSVEGCDMEQLLQDYANADLQKLNAARWFCFNPRRPARRQANPPYLLPAYTLDSRARKSLENVSDPNDDPNADRSGKHRTVFTRCFLSL